MIDRTLRVLQGSFKHKELATAIKNIYEAAMARSLPSVLELMAFEAAARRLSFTEAARDLRITQAAISFRIKTLEGRLGVKLFSRDTHLQLTNRGRFYLPIVTDVLRRLERGTERAIAYGTSGAHKGTSLRLLVAQALASLWLVPRLGKFCERHPGISLSVVSWIGGSSTISPADFGRHHIDAAILNSRLGTSWSGLESDVIVPDSAVPVCCSRLFGDLRRRMQPSDLSEHTWIHTRTWPDAWSTWLAAAGANSVEPKDSLWLEHTGLSVQAASNGLGWAIAHGPLVAGDILAGRLVAPFRPPLANDFAYFLVYPREFRSSTPVRIFRTWFRSEITRDLERIGS